MQFWGKKNPQGSGGRAAARPKATEARRTRN